MKKRLEVFCDLGLTINQARVYASIIDFKSVTAKDISVTTKLHIQDVYKIIPKLVKMGLATKSLNRPAIIEALPVRKALLKLITEQKASALKRAEILDEEIKKLDNIQKDRNTFKIRDSKIFILPAGKALDAKAASVFNSKLIKYDLVCSWKYFLKIAAPYLKTVWSRIAKNATIQILVTCPLSQEVTCLNKVENTIKKIAPKDRFFTGKILIKDIKSNFALLNDMDLWITNRVPKEKGDIIIENSIDTATIAKEAFEYFWNDPLAKTVIMRNNP